MTFFLIQLFKVFFTVYAIRIFVVNGAPENLPETIQATNANSSACYGTHSHFQPSCNQHSGTVIGIQAVKLGAKPRALNCSESVSDDDQRNDTCCTPDPADCIMVYDYTDAAIDYRYHIECSGYSECTRVAPIARDTNSCDNTTTEEYMELTNYMFMEYACIPESRIGDMCANQTYSISGLPFYLQSSNYPNSTISANIDTCNCYVKSTSDLLVYTLDLRLQTDSGECKQTVTVTDFQSSTQWNCDNATVFNVTKTDTANEVWVNLTNGLNTDGGYIWFGFEAASSGSLTISCTQQDKDLTLTTTTTTTTTITLSPQSSKQKGGTQLGPIIGAVIGVLVIIVLIIIALCCYLKKRAKRKEEEKTKLEGKDGIIGHMQPGILPMNEKFKPSKIPKNKVEPTKYIEEHGGISTLKPWIIPPISQPGKGGKEGKQNKQKESDDSLFPPTQRQLPPLSTTLGMANGTVKTPTSHEKINEHTKSSEHKRKKKKHKHRKHKHKAKNKVENIKNDDLTANQDDLSKPEKASENVDDETQA